MQIYGKMQTIICLTGCKGDCEDWAISVVSMMLSGEISIKENGSLYKTSNTCKSSYGIFW